MKEMKRILSLVLCFVMVVGLLPMSVFATDYSIVVDNERPNDGRAENDIVIEDGMVTEMTDILATNTDTDYLFFATDRHTDTSIIGTLINKMEESIGEDQLEYLGLGGDMVGSGSSHPAYNSSTVLSEITGATTSLSAANVDIVAGIHDMNVNDDKGIVLPYSGGGAQIYEGDSYYVYGVPESCISGDVSDVDPSTEADDFVTWANGSDIDKSKVIIVLSHYPLHVKRSDNIGAYYWHEALNTVAGATTAEDGTITVARNIVFFHGHNHTTDPTEYVYEVGDTMAIQAESSTKSETIYYTYATAGYLSQERGNGQATLMAITDDTITMTKYGTSGAVSNMATVTRVVQEETKTVTSIAVSGDTEYFVGDELDLTVTATYSDSSTADVTADATLSGYDLSTAGTYTVTAAYEGLTATTSITVNEVQLNSIAVTTQPTKVTYVTGEALDTTGMVVTATYNNGTTAEVTGWYTSAVDMTTAGEKEVTVNYVVDGITFKTTFTITVEEGVAEGVTLTGIEITSEPTKTEYLLSQELDLDGMVVVATFSDGSTVELQYKPFSTSTIYGGYELYNFSMYVEKAHELAVVYTFGDVTCYDTTTINVWNEDFTDENTGVKVHVGEGEYGVTEAVVTESTNENVASAIQYVIAGDNYVAYDITLTYEEGYSATEDVKTVTLPIPEGVTNPVVYYVSDSGKSVVDMKAEITEDGEHVTFTTTHFSTYVLGDGTTIETGSQDAVTEGTANQITAYVLTNSLTANGEYLIVNINAAGAGYAMGHSGTSVASDSVTVKSDGTNIYIESSDVDSTSVWTATTKSSGFELMNGSYYVEAYGSTSKLYISTEREYSNRYWVYSSNKLYYDGGSGDHAIQYSSNTFSSTKSSATIYIYQKQTITAGTVGHTYSVEGADMEVAAVKDATVDLSSILFDTPTDTNVKTDITAASGLTPTYEVVTTKGNPNVIAKDENGNYLISGNTATLSGVVGTAVVKVTYTSGDLVAWDEFIVTTTTPDHYSIQLHTNDNGTLGEEITAPVALKGVKAGDTYSVWAVVKAHASADDETGVDLGALGSALSWTVSDTSIATIDPDTGVITFTGNNYGTFDVTVAYEGADGKVITDTITISVTESQYVVPGDGTDDFPEYPNEGAVRFDKTATAVGNYSETGLALVELSMTGVPYTTGNELDVVLMLDITGSMHDKTSSSYTYSQYVRVEATIIAAKAFVESIVVNEDGTYNDNRVGVYSFNSGGTYTLLDLGTISSDEELEAAYDAIEGFNDNYKGGGTPYDDALSAVQSTLAAAKTTNLPEGVDSAADYDRQQFCVFMTDGVPTDYEYITGTTHANYSSASSIAGMLTSSDNYCTRDSDYYYEYYSTEMKKDNVTVYAVGLGLENENSAWSGSATQCLNLASRLLNDISGPGGETTQPDAVGTSTLSKKDNYFFSVEDADAASTMADLFENIAQKILEAATDVVVEDKVGDKYSVNFSLPGYGTENQLDPTALDGLGEFYIQVVDYVLDSTTHERTGTYTVLENFTFNFDGSLKSHTVDGVACGDTCSHVTTTDGVITKIDGTYFDYEVKADGEYLTWTAEKLTSTELALQYFAHLDNSTGVDEADQVPAGTYYTNEYATLTYTNYHGNQVQQEFPVPQLTWYGAQVSYVFYLVNEAGQPVNRAGRVVPFAEAVYVTNVHTYSVVWNDLEQAAGLEAKYLAENVVPDVYELYDDDASYNVHVYADEEGVNLNNHFVIGGDVTDDYNATWTNAKTTYVFNNKSDGTKYNTVGAYIANDNSDSTNTTAYLCKGEGTVSGVVWTQVELTGDSDFVNGAYYYDVDGVKTRALNYTEGVTYYQLTGASYTAVSGETQWQPGENDSTTGGTVIGGYVYYVDEYGTVYTIVRRSNGQEVYKGFDFANTTVAFAVVWKPELAADTVVVDYGLDVVIDVITNDSMAAGVKEVQAAQPNATINSGAYERDEALTTSVDVYIDANNDADGLKELKVGTATVENLNAVRFSLDKTNGMLFNKPAVFYYEADVNFYDEEGKLQTTSMYSSVTVIPATTVYYEDAYVNLQTVGITYVNEVCEADSGKTYYVENDDGAHTSVTNPVVGETYLVQQYTYTDGWAVEGTAINKQQQQDRPGASKISDSLDADNSYGYDDAYNSMSQYSMGSAAKITVNENTFGTATFTFCGTGFDVISLTSSDTGTILVEVKDATGKTVKNGIVDTYYGYSQNEEGDWVVDAGDTALYQVPVIKYFGMDYGTYTVTITAAYNQFFDHDTTDSSYDLYLDAIRVYDPTGNESDAANKAYAADGEYMPSYFELRDKIISPDAIIDDNGNVVLTENKSLPGIVFIDGSSANASIEEYTNYGPNNELYLASGQSIAFNLSVEGNMLADYETVVRIGLKSVGGTAAVAGLWKAEDDKKVGEMTVTLNTATDMYYDISALSGGTIVITNTGETGSILSITNIKVSYRFNGNAEDLANPDDVENPNVVFTVTKETVEQAVATLPIEQVFVPIEVEIVEQPVTPGKPLKPVQPGKPSVPALPELPTDPVKPIRSIQKAAVSVSFEETVIGSRRVIG